MTHAADKVSLVLVLAFLTYWAGYKFMPTIEGRIAPVVTVAELSNPRAFGTSAPRYRFDATARKMRDCQFIRIEWYFGERGGTRVEVRSTFIDPPQIRGVGEMSWTGLVINAQPLTVLENTNADVIHQCPGRWWQTRTPFFNAKD